MKRIAILVLVHILLLTGTSTVFAVDGERVSWKVEDIGTFLVPAEWQAAKLNLNRQLLDGKKPEDILKSAVEGDTPSTPEGKPPAVEGEPKDVMKPAGILSSHNIQAYQITLNDGTAYHIAWLLFINDTKKMTREEKEFFAQDITEEQKTKIKGFMRNINRGPIPLSYEDPQTKIGFKLVEMVPVEFLKINKRQAFAGGGRVMVTSDGLAFPLYGKGYVFNAKGCIAMALLVTFDGERIFWDPVLSNVMSSLNRR